MKNSAAPNIHRERERRLIDHIERLLDDDRLRLDTTTGRRPVRGLRRDVRKSDREVELKRLMSQMQIYDRQLQARMPVGRAIDVNVSQSILLVFRQTVGRLSAVCLSPWSSLLQGEDAPPVGLDQVKEAIARASAEQSGRVPVTLILASTSGFTAEAVDMARRRGNRSVVLVEPNSVGGWDVHCPPELQTIAAIFDPELDADKRQRLRDRIAVQQAELLGGGLSSQQLAAATQLPVALVEDELRAYARERKLAAKQIDGQLVVFREGSLTTGSARAGGVDMPFIQRLKTMFGGKDEVEKKIAMLSERRAALSVQRDRSYEEMAVLEQKEAELREQFKASPSTITRRRVTSQLVQLRKDLERRQQLLGMLNQQVNVVGTHLHNLELVQQGKVAQLPSSEELASDAAAAEEVLAELQANAEMAGTVAVSGSTGLTEEEQALYEELEREAGGPGKVDLPTVEAPQPQARATPQRQPIQPPPLPAEKNREAEPG